MEIKKRFINALEENGYVPSNTTAQHWDEMGGIVEEAVVYERVLKDSIFGVATFETTFHMIATRNNGESLPEIIYDRKHSYDENFMDQFKEANKSYREKLRDDPIAAEFTVYSDDGKKIFEAPDSNEGVYKIIIQNGRIRFEYADEEEPIATKAWMNVDDVAIYIGRKPNTIYKYVEKRIIPCHKPPNTQLLAFRKDEIDNWIETGRQETHEEYLKRISS